MKIPECFEKKFEKLKKAILESKEIRILAHYDADGVSAAAIMFRTLKNKKIHISFVKDLSKDNVKRFLDERKEFYIFLDMGSSLISLLEGNINGAVLDHHPPEKDSEKIIHINPHLCGIPGSRDACGSTIAYLFSIYMDEANFNLYPLFLSGAIGDKQNIGGYSGLNRLILDMLMEKNITPSGTLRIQGRNLFESLLFATEPFIDGFSGNEENVKKFLESSGLDPEKRFESLDEDKKIRLSSWIAIQLIRRNVEREIIESIVVDSFQLDGMSDYLLSDIIDACSRQDKQGLALAYLSGDVEREQEVYQTFLEHKKNLIREIYSAIRNKKEMKNLQYFYVSEDSMAGAVSGTLMMYYFDRDKVTIGLHEKDGEVRVSGRATRYLVSKGINLGVSMGTCAERVNGFGGGHDIAAGANIPTGKVNEFLECLDGILGEQINDTKITSKI
ncbi:MAG: DHHA1 domain-containing protein [Thermoplasmata archaeon]